MIRNGRASSILVPSTNSHKNNIYYMNKIWHIGLTNKGEIVVESDSEESIVFPPDITRLLYYSMCTFYNNKSKLC